MIGGCKGWELPLPSLEPMRSIEPIEGVRKKSEEHHKTGPRPPVRINNSTRPPALAGSARVLLPQFGKFPQPDWPVDPPIESVYATPHESHANSSSGGRCTRQCKKDQRGYVRIHCYIPGSFIPASLLPKLALPICLNIFFICAYWRSS